jgi:uncharacterized damage-inducible protein DinB
MKESVMPAHLDSYIKTWNRVHEQTKRIMTAAPNDKYDWKPCESAMSLGELVNHPWISEWGLIEAALTGSFPKEWPAPLSDTASALAAFDKAHEEAVAKVMALTPEQLAEDVAPFSPERPLTRMAVLKMNLEHEIHHRGQLYTYLRIAGCEIPPLFSAETVQEFDDGR